MFEPFLFPSWPKIEFLKDTMRGQMSAFEGHKRKKKKKRKIESSGSSDIEKCRISEYRGGI